MSDYTISTTTITAFKVEFRGITKSAKLKETLHTWVARQAMTPIFNEAYRTGNKDAFVFFDPLSKSFERRMKESGVASAEQWLREMLNCLPTSER